MRLPVVMLGSLLLLTACSQDAVDSQWAEERPMSVPRSEHPAVLLDDEIVVVGGLVEAGLGRVGVTETVEAYDPGSGEWRRLPDLPEPRHHVMASVVGGRLYVIGGFGASGFDPVDSVWELEDGTWVDRARLPAPLGAGTAVTVDDAIFVVGGTPGGGLMRYDPVDDVWVELSAPEVFREHLAAVVLDGDIWAIAGREPGRIHSSTDIYDVESDEWRSGPGLAEARSGFGAVVVGGSIYVAGGEVFQPTETLDSVEVFDPASEEWRLVSSLPLGLHGNPLIEVGGILYLPGGSTEAGAVENSGDMWSLDLN